MKTQRLNMKWIIVLAISLTVFACSKGEENEEIVEAIKKEELKRKIADIIPQQYQDTLAKLGITLNQDIYPPIVDGVYGIRPLKLVKSNRPQDSPNMTFADVSVKFFGQDKDNNLKLIGKSFVATADTSIVTAVSGKGNDFTVYDKVKSQINSNSAIFGIILSGTKDGNVLRNVRYGIINIDNSKGGTVFIKQGEARAVFDTDLVSETIPMF